MNVYQLHVAPGEYDSDGEDFDEWFLSLREAKRRRAELIAGEAESPENTRVSGDFAIERLTIAKMPRRALVVALLRRKGFVTERVEVVPAYIFPRPSPEQPDPLST